MPSKKTTAAQVVDFFASVKLAMVVLLVLAVASIGGTVIPQNLPDEKYLGAYGPGLYTFLSYLDMFDMYRSWWFNALLLLLVINLVVCSARRLPTAAKLARPIDPHRIKIDFLGKQRFSNQTVLAGPVEDEIGRLSRTFARYFGRPGEVKNSWGSLLWSEKGAWSRFGAYVVHLSILVIVAGAMIGWAYGFSAFLELNEEQTSNKLSGLRPQKEITLPFFIRLDKFSVQFYPTGAPSDYRSDVTIIEQGRKRERASIRVNHPLTYGGITFYQSSYGERHGVINLEMTRRSDGRTFKLSADLGRAQTLPEGSGRFMVRDFTQDLMKAGPAVKVFIQPKDDRVYFQWAYKKEPDSAPSSGSPWTVRLLDHQVQYYTGLQVNKDPGVGLIWTGCGLMLLGFAITFFMTHWRVFLGLAPQGPGRTLAVLAGSTHRRSGAFKIKFDRLAAEIPDLKAEKDNHK